MNQDMIVERFREQLEPGEEIGFAVRGDYIRHPDRSIARGREKGFLIVTSHRAVFHSLKSVRAVAYDQIDELEVSKEAKGSELRLLGQGQNLMSVSGIRDETFDDLCDFVEQRFS